MSLSALTEKPGFVNGKTPGFSANADRLIVAFLEFWFATSIHKRQEAV